MKGEAAGEGAAGGAERGATGMGAGRGGGVREGRVFRRGPAGCVGGLGDGAAADPGPARPGARRAPRKEAAAVHALPMGAAEGPSGAPR